MRETMKEVVVTAPHKVEIREAPIPVPKDDEVLIRMKSAGGCGSDHHIYHGTNLPIPEFRDMKMQGLWKE